ncbi:MULTISPECIES: NUDIX domain-containing protein [unclassified Leptolyngbya]|uniref:bis(5'-nucleosyl)-tetraphosphatase n=1 Tax=unclassified Leptolyngbya TaxID=2650499 RepID=UPI0016856BE3|nr:MULTISPECIES: NUDIX domain-containing protein [unclassified Leptolyngbya]MBD1912252.1 NUDIX domain-containing protein [Leptolyngbya sp. FACHB-8]MBD2155143.1 NUDIX domain-containing protein [Leptolyngbya sp. FACHB-16]
MKPEYAPQKKDEAFGLVPIWKNPAGDRVLLIQHHAGHWGFPKGHADPGETALMTACREFEEETGITEYKALPDKTFIEQYRFMRDGYRVEKTVTYFLAWVYSTTVVCQEQEIRNYAWLLFDDAARQISFNPARQVLRQVQAHLPTL